jgi:ribokinase
MVVVFGSINLDLVFRVAHLPAPGETVSGPDYVRMPGGKGANQALAAARAGSPAVMGGAVGDDDFARQATQALRDEGIDVGRIVVTGTSTGCAAVCVDDRAENQIVVASGANALATHACIEDALLVPSNVLILQNEVPVEQSAILAQRARRRGVRVIWNAAPARGIDRDALECVDVLVVNEIEAAFLSAGLGLPTGSPPELAAGVHDRLGIDVVLTCGASGSVAATRQGAWRIRALAVAAVDTTGAGDAFVGVLASALERGLDHAEAFAQATVGSALACLGLGAQASLPTAERIRAHRHRLGEIDIQARRPGG